MEKEHNKLVRDNIPEIIKSQGIEPVTRILDDEEYLKELLKKLVEESNEALNASSSADLLEELADVYEVMSTITRVQDCDMDIIKTIATEKRHRRGGFSNKIYLEKTITKD